MENRETTLPKLQEEQMPRTGKRECPPEEETKEKNRHGGVRQRDGMRAERLRRAAAPAFGMLEPAGSVYWRVTMSERNAAAGPRRCTREEAHPTH